MSGIQSSVGLITGIPIQDTVDQLMALSARPRDLLVSRTQESTAEQGAVDQLASLVLGLRFSLTNLDRTSTYTSRTATSSVTSAVSVTVPNGASPKLGSYQLTPLRTASAHQLVSSSLSDLQDAIGEGELKFRFGGHVDKGIALSQLNSGNGFTPGKIRITDRSGATGVIDLRGAVTIDDVISAINESEAISVTASTSGDSLVLTDNTGESGNFRVQEVSGGTTAATLGLAGLNAAADTLTGSDVFSLHEGALLSTLNDGGGVWITDSSDELAIDDLVFTLADETEAGVDLSGATTLGDVVDAINNDEDLAGKVSAAISADGNRLEVTDLTSGAGAFAISNNSALGTAADDLGLSGAASGGVITGERLVSGLKDTLVSSLNGGRGFTLGAIDVTDRSGGTDTVDLSSAETLSQIVDLLNASSADITASINSSRNGIQILDSSGGTGNLIVAENGGGTTAADLGIAVDDTVSSVNTGSLSRRVASNATLLSSLNRGEGVDLDDFQITDSAGKKIVVDLDTTD
ncbi:MAG: hypothetical protein KDA37_04390, partial [Planctomycetales bacterium]|nr:hypothetical protein [Planctomycetales bacterium]